MLQVTDHDLGELRRLVPHVLLDGSMLSAATRDATSSRAVRGRADALVLPEDRDGVAAIMRWCYEREVPMCVRGGGTGLAAGAVPQGGVVISLERLATVRSHDPGLWRMEAEAGVRTATVHRLARESGLLFPPDPGAGEQSTLGGNIATNAGGPHAFKYGVTGSWVTGLEVVLAPGEVVRIGGPIRKDVAGYDLLRLMVGSEGTLGVVTAAWLRLVPAPERTRAIVAFYPDSSEGCRAITRVMEAGVEASALEFLDGGALRASLGSFPLDAPGSPGFAVLGEVDGSAGEVERAGAELAEALEEGSSGAVSDLVDRAAVRALWAWRDGVSGAVTAARGGKVSEDIVVPLDRLAEAIEGTLEIGRRRALPACSWGHAGDGNVHATFLVSLDDPAELERAELAAGDTFELAIRLGGSISGEHGIGSLKTPWVARALDRPLIAIQDQLKGVFDPKRLLNPGKKVIRA